MKLKKKNWIKNKYLMMMLCALLIFGINAVIVRALDINNCGILGFSEETYTLTANVSTSEAICFTINAADITLDCNGYTITTNDSSGSNGVYSIQPNTLIKNCDNYTRPETDNDYTKKALFDILAEIVSEPKNPGEDLIIKISLINFGASNTIDANLKYTISNSQGEIIEQYQKVIPVTTQAEFLDYINTTGLTDGKYFLKIELTYEKQSFPASTEKVFYIGTIKKLFRNVGLKTFILPVITLGLLIGVYKKRVMNRLKRENEHNRDANNKYNINDNSNNTHHNNNT